MGELDRFPRMLAPEFAGIAPELGAVVMSIEACGFTVPADTTAATLHRTVMGAFAASQVAGVEGARDVSRGTREYLGNIVQSQLHWMAERSDERALRVAHQGGRLMAANGARGPVAHHVFGFTMEGDELVAAGRRVPYAIETGLVVEYGMGIGGTMAHAGNAGAGKYKVHGIQKEKGETHLLRGMAERQGLTEGQMRIDDRGIAYRLTGLQKAHTGGVDMIIAARVHAARGELHQGVTKASRLLRGGGLFIGLGPQAFGPNYGYDTVARLLRADGKMDVMIDHQFVEENPNGLQLHRLIVGQRK